MANYEAVFDLAGLDGGNGFRIDGEATEDYSGFWVASAGDVNGDGLADVIVSAFDADPHGSSSGASYVVFGKASAFPVTLALSGLDGDNGFEIDGELAGDHSGWPVASAGDVNGDGYCDLIIGAPNSDPNGSYSGATYVVFGNGSGFAATFDLSALDGSNGFQINGEETFDFSGRFAASAGDINGDGYSDLLVGAGIAGDGGKSYVVFGKASGFDAALELSSLNGANGFEILGAETGDQAGLAVAPGGDVNGDGIDDLLIGAPGAPHYTRAGATYVVFGKLAAFDATLDLAAIDGSNGFRIDGEHSGDQSASTIASAGDVDADGVDDLIIGADTASPNGEWSGSSYVVFGKTSGFGVAFELADLDGSNGFRMDGEAADDQAGYQVASAGDFNGDGFADLIVGARGAGASGARNLGAGYVVFGKAGGFDASLNLSTLDGNNGFKIPGLHKFDYTGSSVASAGDINGDGFSDLILGANGADPNGSHSGSSYVVLGAMPGEAVERTGTDIANTIHGGDFGDRLTGLGGDDVLDGHGGRDTLVGGSGDDTLRGGAARDILKGGDGADRFVFDSVSESTGRGRDTVQRADLDADSFDVIATIGGIDATVSHGALSRGAAFGTDLAAAIDGVRLGAFHAVLFTPDGGTFAGRTFLVADANGIAGYQAGADLVIQLNSAQNLANLDVGDFV